MRKHLCAFVLTLACLTPPVVAQGPSEPAKFAGLLLDSLVMLAREKQAITRNPFFTRLYLAAAGKMAPFVNSRDRQVPAAAEALRVFFEACSKNDARLEQLLVYVDLSKPPPPSVVEAAVSERDALVARTSDVVRANIEVALLTPMAAGTPQVLRLSSKERAALVRRLNQVLPIVERGRAPGSDVEPESAALQEVVTLLNRDDLRAINEDR